MTSNPAAASEPKTLKGCEQDDTPHGHVGKYCIYDIAEVSEAASETAGEQK
jgi:hypothetical protein